MSPTEAALRSSASRDERSIDPSESASDQMSSMRTVEGRASTERSQSPIEASSSCLASGCDHGSSGSTVALSVPEEPLDALVVRPLLVAREREHLVAPRDTFEQIERLRALLAEIARLEREPELLDEPEVRRVDAADDLAAELRRAATVDIQLLHAPADAIARLEDGHVRAPRGEVARGGQAGEPGPEHEHVAHSASG